MIQENCPQTITHFSLINAASGSKIFELNKYENPVVVNVLEVGNQLNIQANTSPKVVGSVVFELDGEVFNIENVLPYALAGDEPPREYRSWTPSLGKHTLTATPYTERKGRGTAGIPLTITFEVVEDSMAVAKTMSVTPPKVKAAEDLTVAQNITQVMVYPNPSEGLLRIKLPDTAQAVNLYLYNAQGHQVMETAGEVRG